MLIDARLVPENQIIQTDVCIVGAGAAGITLAREFTDQPFDICLLESGGMKPKRGTRALSIGESIGNDYRPLQYVRSRCFGGTTNIWHGGCEELDALDFKERSWIPHSGWPFAKSHLAPFYRRARTVCQLPSFAYDEEWERSHRSHLPLNSRMVTQKILYLSSYPRFGAIYREEIINATNITMYLNANVVEIVTNSKGDQVTQLRVSSFQGHEFLVRSKLIILAAGGIENPRLLLASNRVNNEGLGNKYDLVGRFFMTHPILDSGVLFPVGQTFSEDWYRYYKANGGYPKTSISLSEEAQYKHKLMNLNLILHAGYKEFESDGVASLLFLMKEIYMTHWCYIPPNCKDHLRRVWNDFQSVSRFGLKMIFKNYKLTKRIEAFQITNLLEQAPSPDSRVLLSTKRDALGVKRVQLDWRLGQMEKKSLGRSHEILWEVMKSASAGRLLIKLNTSEESWPSILIGMAHHIGTTRMHKDPEQGVVDENCRVHSMSNLFVIGSSVFPTSGAVRPTFTIVALALRLADHIKQLMKCDLKKDQVRNGSSSSVIGFTLKGSM